MAASPATSSSNSTSSFAATAPGFFCSGADLSNSFPPSHDIFISHSGMQKDFCTELYYHLNHNLYSTFLDITDHSLPLGQDFPSHIFAAARTCRLAVLVISEDYLLSKWPMLELSAFVFAPSPQPNILPLFFKLSPKDLKERHYRDKWQATWKEFKEADPDRIDLLKFNYAFDKLLSLNGIQLKQSEGEHAYIRRVCKEICQNLPPSLTHDFSGLHGLQRMSKAVLTEFEELTERSSNRPVYVVGMHGLPKSGKSTLCRYLCHRLFSLYAGKALHLELRTDATEEELLVNAKELLTRLSDFNNKLNLARVSNLRQIYQQLKSVGFSSMRLLLIVDNITSPESIDFVQSLLRLGLGAGSGVLLVARTCNTLYSCLPRYKDTNHHAYALCPSMPAPRLNNREALRVLLQAVDAVDLPDTYEPEHCLTPAQLELAEKVVRMCANEWGHHLPLVLELVGKQLRDNGLQDKNDFVKEVWWFKEKALESLLALGFRKLRQKQKDLFLDIALFILPLSYSQNLGIKQTCYYLGLIHGRTPLEIELELKELQKHSFAYNPPGEITIRREPIVRIHDVYLEFAASIDEATTYFWSSGQRWSKVKCPQAIEQVESCRLRTIVFEELERKELQFSRGLLWSTMFMDIDTHGMPGLMDVLPDAVVQLVLFNIKSARDVAACSCVCKRWRELMSQALCLHFTRNVGDEKGACSDRIVTRMVLAMTSLQQLTVYCHFSPVSLVAWLSHAKLTLRHLELRVDDLAEKQPANISMTKIDELSSCPELRILQLWGVLLSEGPRWQTFCHLHTLQIVGARLKDLALHGILSACPALVNLTLLGCSGVQYATIDMAYLKHCRLDFYGLGDCCIKIVAPRLEQLEVQGASCLHVVGEQNLRHLSVANNAALEEPQHRLPLC